MDRKLYSIDGILWSVDKHNDIAIPICPKDKIELSSQPYDDNRLVFEEFVKEVNCEECKRSYTFKRSLRAEKKYVVEKVRALEREDYEIIDMDGIKTPVTKKERLDLNNGFFCVAQIRDSKRGPQVVIYAGKKGLKEKSQILITPEERRLSFDQNDINPADVFTKITAEFDDGTKHIIKRNKNEK